MRERERGREACYDKEGTARDRWGELTSSPLLLPVKCRNNYVSTGSDRNIEDATTKCQRSWGEVEGEEEEKEGKSSGTRRLFRKDATKLDGTSGSRLEKYWSMRGEERISWTTRMTCASCSSSVGQDHVCWHISSLETLLFRDSLLPLFASSSSFLSPSYACLNCLNASIERKSNKNEKFRSFSICSSEKNSLKRFKTRIPPSFQIDFEVSRER